MRSENERDGSRAIGSRMNGLSFAPRPTRRPLGETGPGSAYCAFKNDRARLLALVSRDVRMVLIAIALACTLPSTPALLLRAVATVISLA